MQNYYPLIIYPYHLLEILERYPKKPVPPIEPTKPISPEVYYTEIEENKKGLITGCIATFIFIIGIVLAFNDLVIGKIILVFSFWGPIFLIIALYIYPSTKRKYYEYTITYNNLFAEYEKQVEVFKLKKIEYEQKIILLSSTESIKRFRKIERFKMEVIQPIQLLQKDPFYESRKKNKKGISHDFFLNHLKHCFGNKISNNMYTYGDSLYLPENQKEFQDNHQTDILYSHLNDDFKHRFMYYPEFVYVDAEKNIVVDIEIDEPYEYSTGKPLFFKNDFNSNKLDINSEIGRITSKWTVIRFAEEQIIKYPYECIMVIRELIDKYLNVEMIDIEKLNFPKINIWSEEEAHELAFARYRDSYLPDEFKNEMNNSFI